MEGRLIKSMIIMGAVFYSITNQRKTLIPKHRHMTHSVFYSRTDIYVHPSLEVKRAYVQVSESTKNAGNNGIKYDTESECCSCLGL